LTGLSGAIGKGSGSSLFRSFRAVKSARGPEAPSWANPNQRTVRSAASDEDEALRRWSQYVCLLFNLSKYEITGVASQ